MAPKFIQAKSDRRSVSQYRLGRRNGSASGGKSETAQAGVGGAINLVLPPVSLNDALEPQRQRVALREHASDDISLAVDEPGRRNRRRELEFRLTDDGVATIGVDIHHGQNCRRLREVERNVEAIANMHLEIPEQAVREDVEQPHLLND